MASYISGQRVGAGYGLSKVWLIALSLFGDAADSDDGVCADGRLVALSFPFPLRAGTSAASPGHSLSPLTRDAIPLVLTISTLTHFEQRGGDASRLSRTRAIG